MSSLLVRSRAVSHPLRAYTQLLATAPTRQLSTTTQLRAKFGAPNETTIHPPGGHPHNTEPKEHRPREGHNRYRPPEDHNARANREDKEREYKENSRRVTVALISAPIALVTSYVLYDRIIAGNDKRNLTSGK